jgi:hypothetical protein
MCIPRMLDSDTKNIFQKLKTRFSKNWFFAENQTPNKFFFNILYSRELRFFLVNRYMGTSSDEANGFFC